MKIDLEITPIQQTGHICKPTAIAMVDKYYAKQIGFQPIPLNKRNNPLHQSKKNFISMRELAKKHGSMQGELLEMQQVEGIFKDIGYDIGVVVFKDNFELFKLTIMDGIKCGHLIFAAFSVNTSTGAPTTEPDDDEDKNEHAAIIHGFNEEEDSIYFTHWGKKRICTFKEFYDSSMVLLGTRQPEYYRNVKGQSANQYKYDLVDDKEQIENSMMKVSITAKENSGFRGQCVVIQKPQLDKINVARKQFIQESSQNFNLPLKQHLLSLQNTSKFQTKHSNLSNVKHITHVFLDGEIGGTPLGGFAFLDALSFFSDFLNWLQVKTVSKDEKLTSIIRKLAGAPVKPQANFLEVSQTQLKSLYMIETQRQEIVNNFRKKTWVILEDVENELTKLAKNVLKELEAQQDLFVFGGFSGHPSHAMMYRLIKQKDGSVYFCIYNSGAGMNEFHESVLLDSGKLGYYPIYAFCIPESIDETRLSQWLVTIFNFIVLPEIKSKLFCYTERDLYKVFDSSLTWLSASILSASKLSEPVSGERDGICVWKSIEQWMRAIVPSRSTYREFLLAYRLYLFQYALEDFTLSQLNGIVSLEKEFPGYQLLLQRALPNMVRMLNPDLKKEVLQMELNEEEQKVIISSFKSWKKALKTTEIKASHHIFYNNSYLEPMNSSLNINPNLATALNVTPIPIVTSIIQELTYSPQGMRLNEALEELNRLLQIPDLHESTYQKWIECFCATFTNLKNPIGLKNQTLEQQQSLMVALTQVLRRYQQYQPELTPRAVIIYLSLMSIVDRLGKEGEDNVFHFGEHALSCLSSLYGQDMHEFIQRLFQNPFLSTFDATLDNLWERVRIFYEDQATQIKSLDYYCSLILQANESEKQVLRTHWKKISGEERESVELKQAIDNFFPSGQQACYCYLNQEEKNKILGGTPELDLAFQLQESQEQFLINCIESIAVCGGDAYFLCSIRSNLHIEVTKEYIYKWEMSVELKLKSIVLTNDRVVSGMHWFLKRSLLEYGQLSKDPAIADALTSSYDGNAPTSQEIPNLQTTYSKDRPGSREYREGRKYKFLFSGLSSEKQSAVLLQHLRVSMPCQVVALLSELKNHPNWVSSHEWSQYILLSLFQPGALLASFKNGPALWKQLEYLSVQHHLDLNDSYLSQEKSWFMLKLTAMISGYALDAQRHGLLTLGGYEGHALAWQELLLQVMQLRLKAKSLPTDLNVLREWHHLRLESLMRLDDKFSPDKEEAFIESYWFLAFLPKSLAVGAQIEEQRIQSTLEKAYSYLAVFDIKEWPARMLRCFEKLDFHQMRTSEILNLQVQFPLIQWQTKDCTMHMNILMRTMMRNDEEFGYVPSFIQSTAEFRELFGSQTFLVTKQTVTIDIQDSLNLFDCYQWSVANQAYRVLFCVRSQHFMLQKKQNNQWYTYSTPSKGMAKGLGFTNHAFTEPPPLFDQALMRVWVCDDENWMVVKNGFTDVLYTKKGNHCYLGSPSDAIATTYNLTGDVPQLLSRIDSPQFIRVLDSELGTYWYLERYDLHVLKGNEPNTYLTQGRRYELRLPTHEEDIFGTGLVQCDTKDPLKKSYLIPVQPYYVQNDFENKPVSSGVQYAWVHDLSNYLAKEDLFGKESSTAHSGWNYTDSEQYVVFQMDNNNEPVAQSSVDQLYLAYLYLAQDRPQKALECIRTCSFQGSFEEMERLWWIIVKLPAKGDKIKNSRVIAVQMAALYAILKIKNQFPRWSSMRQELREVNSNTTRYRQSERRALFKFIEDLPQQLECHYMIYDNRRNNIPEYMLLRVADEKLMLSHVQAKRNRGSDDGFRYQAVMGYRYLKLFPEQGSKASFQVQQHYMRAKTFLILPLNWKERLQLFGSERQLYFNLDTKITVGNELQAKLLQQLHPYMSIDLLLKNLGSYYVLARDGDDATKAALQHFCKTIMAFYAEQNNKDSRDEERKEAFLLVSEILWVVTYNSQFFIENYKNYILFHELSAIAKASGSNIPAMVIDVFQRHFKYSTCSVKQSIFLQAVQSRELAFKSEVNVVSFLENIPFFNEVRKKLEDIEKCSQKEQIKILEELKVLTLPKEEHGGKSLSLDEQKQQMIVLDERFLALQNQLKKDQSACYEQYSKQQKDALSQPIQDAQRALQDKALQARKTIEVILERRVPDIIAELGKSQISTTLKRLLQDYPEITDGVFDSMGILTEDRNELKEQLRQFLAIADTQKRMELLLEAYQKDEKSSTLSTRTTLVRSILSNNQAIRKHEALFQYINTLALRPEQAQFLEKLVAINNGSIQSLSKALQLMMGGGKTKVILPLLAYDLADSDKLPIVLVPDMSLHTNFCDLSARSIRSFQQEPYLLQFNRNSLDDPASLQELYETLQTVRMGKRYLVTTTSTWQSLELKYLEILNDRLQHSRHPIEQTEQERDEQQRCQNQQLHWLGEILTLTREKGVAIIDEAHSLLHVRKELNYATGDSKAIDPDVVEFAVDLYLWMDHSLKFVEILADPSTIINDACINTFMTNTIDLLCADSQHQDANYWVRMLVVDSVITQEQLKQYLLGKTSEIEDDNLYQRLDKHPGLKKRLILLRGQFQTLLPITLRRKLLEHYGPSEDSNFPFSIPYRANNVPTSFVFGHFMETLNYTIQMMLYKGLSLEALKSVLVQWQEDAHLERLENGNKISQSEQIFALIFSKSDFAPLLQQNLADNDTLKKLHDHGRRDRRLLNSAMQACLQRLMIEPSLLRSDALNLVSQFKQIYAVTGTPGNYRTYHPSINMLHETSLGTESQVIEYLLSEKTTIQGIDVQSIDMFLWEMITKHVDIYALIEYGGFLRGVTNLEVAKKLAILCSERNTNFSLNDAIQWILFYQGDSLYAWDVTGSEEQTPKILSSTDAGIIETELNNCTAKQRFTYYDQEHTLGSDITQTINARGIVTVDSKLGELSKKLQADMRFRDLGAGQALVVVVNEASTTPSMLTLIKTLRDNEQKVLQSDYFRSSQKKIHNLFRDDLMQRLLLQQKNGQIPDELYQQAEFFFVEVQESEVIKLCQTKATEKPTETILHDFAIMEQALWEDIIRVTQQSNVIIQSPLIAPVELPLGNEVIPVIKKELLSPVKNIIQEAVFICSKTQWSQNMRTGVEVQQQKQEERQKEIQTQKELENPEEYQKPVFLRDIDCRWITNIIHGKNNVDDVCVPLQKIIAEQYPGAVWFSLNLYASKVFSYTYIEQKDFYTPYSKPGLAMLFMVLQDGTTRGILVCMEEAEILRQFLLTRDATQYPAYWLTTLNGDGFTPIPSLVNEFVKSEIASLLEQAQFLTGKITSLLSKPLSPWFKEQIQEKSDFLRTIAPFVSIKAEELSRFNNKVMNLESYVETWAKSQMTCDMFIQDLVKKNTPKTVIVRLIKLIQALEIIRKNIMNSDDSPINQDISLEEGVLIQKYQNLYRLIVFCAKRQVIEAAKQIVAHPELMKITYDYYLPGLTNEDKEIANYHHNELCNILTEHPELNYFLTLPSISTETLNTIFSDLQKFKPILVFLRKFNFSTKEFTSLVLKSKTLIDYSKLLSDHLLENKNDLNVLQPLNFINEHRQQLLLHFNQDPVGTEYLIWLVIVNFFGNFEDYYTLMNHVMSKSYSPILKVLCEANIQSINFVRSVQCIPAWHDLIDKYHQDKILTGLIISFMIKNNAQLHQFASDKTPSAIDYLFTHISHENQANIENIFSNIEHLKAALLILKQEDIRNDDFIQLVLNKPDLRTVIERYSILNESEHPPLVLWALEKWLNCSQNINDFNGIFMRLKQIEMLQQKLEQRKETSHQLDEQQEKFCNQIKDFITLSNINYRLSVSENIKKNLHGYLADFKGKIDDGEPNSFFYPPLPNQLKTEEQAIDALINAINGKETNLIQFIQAFSVGMLGKQIELLVTNGQASIVCNQEISTVQEFLAAFTTKINPALS